MGRAGEKDILCRVSPDTEAEIKKKRETWDSCNTEANGMRGKQIVWRGLVV